MANQIDMTTPQLDENGRPKNALYLPALSSFYSALLGKDLEDDTFIPQSRVPANFENGIQGMNFQDPDIAYYYYKWCLYSAGHANIDVNKQDTKETMIRVRDRSKSFVLGDSGGFQIGKGVWEGDWINPNCPKAQKKREQVLTWFDAYMDYGMILDIPVWSCDVPGVRDKINIHSFEDAVIATKINNDYFVKNRTGECKLLNVCQGENHTDADTWYNEMKKYCDPAQYPDKHFNGWAMGGQNATDPELILMRLVHIIHDGLLQEGKQDWVHFLGLGKMPWACFLTDVQHAIRKYHNPAVTISMDAASPFLTTANGGCYINTTIKDRGRWAVNTESCVDDKKYSLDTRPFSEVIKEAKGYSTFLDSPITARLMGKDICVYKPGDLNKIGKEGRTSWDSLSYCMLMSHNVYLHIDSIQKAIEAYHGGLYPKVLIDEQFERKTFGEIVDRIFAAPTREEALAIIADQGLHFWGRLGGSRGNKGKDRVNAKKMFSVLFEEESEDHSNEYENETEDGDLPVDETNLINLEHSLD